jgi:hypothetical protein
LRFALRMVAEAVIDDAKEIIQREWSKCVNYSGSHLENQSGSKKKGTSFIGRSR